MGINILVCRTVHCSTMLRLLIVLCGIFNYALASDVLFAIVGGNSCAKQLKYGPEKLTTAGSSEGHPYYFATATGKNIAHTEWTQVVTSDGSNELFRIYWSFTTPKTVADRFIGATTGGEDVSYRVVTQDPVLEYTYSGTWWFSSTAAISADMFKVNNTHSGFSADAGAWGAGSGTINAQGNPNGFVSNFFWGIANWDSDDSDCGRIYQAGVVAGFGSETKSYLYYSDTPTPSDESSSFAPTVISNLNQITKSTIVPSPSTEPTASPTLAPTVFHEQYLFAVVGGTSCAENLYYGPQAITTAGSADGLRPYFLSTSTAAKDAPHTEWLQIVTSDGTTELFRIYWTFTGPAKTLSQRFVDAVSSGEAVSYRVVETGPGDEFHYSGIWSFSNSASITTAKFDSASTAFRFSADDGVWGAGSGNIDGNTRNFGSVSFWGIGNWDSSDTSECSRVYRAGKASVYGTSVKSYMYYFAEVSPTVVPTTAPTAPTRTPSALPTTAPPTARPTRSPSCRPTMKPTGAPSVRPTSAAPSIAATVVGDDHLFAVVGGNSCAETLFFGPQEISTAGSADGLRPYFLSTSTAAKDVAHTNWLQIVTSDGTTELFRIYWQFDVAKTLAQRFIGAVSSGEAVRYRVVDASTGDEFVSSGTWRFSNSASITAAKFAATTTTCCFSADDGVWGAGSGVINGNGVGYTAAAFWGIGNWDSSDSSDCYKVFRAGVASTAYRYSGTKSYMYYTAPTPPTATPTAVPTALTPAPSVAPSVTATRAPTMSFDVPPSMELFAIIGGTNCAENLSYGPQAINARGSADGSRPYFLSTGTASKDVAHRFWLQVVTSDGSTELFRIYWTFDTPRTLAQHFSVAVSTGEAVSFRVVEAGTGQEYLYSGIWRFSNSAGNMATRFETVSTQPYFSSDDGVWGAGNGIVDGNTRNFAAVSFWGIGNWDSSDGWECYRVYRAGSGSTIYGTSVKSYVYYSAIQEPTATPTTAPSNPTVLPSITPTRAPTPAPTRKPSRPPTRSPTRLPSTKPTTKPIGAPPLVPGDAVLFAVVGGYNCAEALYYGPQAITTAGSADGLRPYFLSTSTAAKDVPHTEWLQIVTSDGTTELFRIYWTFTGGAKTLAQRLIDATRFGEAVSYRVVDADSSEYVYSGYWWFSNTASITAAKFATPTTAYGFSSDDGAWGAGSGTINGNSVNYASVAFWGIGNWDNSDSYSCYKVYRAGAPSTAYGTGVKSYMYYRATPSPVVAPTVSPTPVPANNLELFAIVGGSNCAENLAYGPESITEIGAASGNHPYYFSTSTSYKDAPHTEWLQIVTSDGTTELFSIYWTFTGPAKTLAQRFIDATTQGEDVTYRVVYQGGDYYYFGNWWFSNAAGIASSTFSGTSGFLSWDDGAWGAGAGRVDGNGAYPYNFWGVGNFDSSDSSECSAIYMNGVPSKTYGSNTKTFMYYSVDLNVPTTMPTPPPQVTFNVQQNIKGISFLDFLGNVYQTELVLKMAIADSMTGVTVNDLYDFIVRDASVQTPNRKLLSNPTPAGYFANTNSTAPPPELTNPAETSVPLVTPNLRRSNPRPMAAGAAIQTSYTVQVPYTGLTYADLSAQLVSAVETGAFTTQLRTHAEQQGVPTLANATATSIETQEVLAETSDNDSGGGGGLSSSIVGIVVGAALGGFFLVVILLYLICFCCERHTPAPAPAGAAEGLSPPSSAVGDNMSMAKDINMYFYGSGGDGGGIPGRPQTTQDALIPTAPPQDSTQDHDLGVELSSLRTSNHSPHYPTAPPPPPLPSAPSMMSPAGDYPSYKKPEQQLQEHQVNQSDCSADPSASPVSTPAPTRPVPAVAVSLPVAALASPSYGCYGGEAEEIAIAEVYVGEIEEYKES